MPIAENERIQARLERYDSEAGAYREAALKFSLLVVTNLILINAGGLLALANGFFGDKVTASAATTAAGWFIVGLAAALACAYNAYLNFGLLANQQQQYRAAEDWQQAKSRIQALAIEKDVPFDRAGFLADGRSVVEFATECDTVIAAQSRLAKRANGWINLTFAVGQGLGIASGACFCVACFKLITAG